MLRAARGERTTLVDLTHAPVARGLGGTGAPLPTTTRRKLETVFAADLSAVRVHAGVTQNSRAVAAGTHVYLGPDEHPLAPHTFPVLVHEIAHVLQQTAQPGAGGRMIATEQVGTAEPFGWSAPFSKKPVTAPTAKTLLIWSAIADSRSEKPAVARIDAMSTALAAAVDPIAFWKDRAAAVLGETADPALAVGTGPSPKLADLEPLARSALFDALKQNGHTKAAAKLLEAFDRTESLVLDPATYIEFVGRIGTEKLLDRILEIWRDEPILDEARPNKAVGLSATYLTGAFSSVPELPIHDDAVAGKRVFLTDDLLTRLTDAQNALTFFPGELVFSALLAIKQLEDYRISWLKPPADGWRKVLTHDPVLDERVTVADRLVKMAAFVKGHAEGIRAGTEKDFDGSLETRHLVVRNLAPTLGALGAWALEFWNTGELLDRGGVDPARKLTANSLLGIGYAQTEPFPGLRAAIAKHQTDFFARLPSGALPTSSQYATRVITASGNLLGLIQNVQSRVVERVNRAWTVPGTILGFDAKAIPADRTELLAQAAWLIATLSAYRKSLLEYKQTPDDLFSTTFKAAAAKLTPPITQWPADDLRVMHRAHLATLLLELARRAGLDDVADAMRSITNAGEALPQGGHQEDDILAIVSPFTPQPRGAIGKLAEDMQGQQLAGAEQFTTQQLVLFFQGDRYRRISDHIDSLLGGPEGKKFELSQVPILNQAIEGEDVSPLQPIRHTIGPAGFAYIHRDPTQGGFTVSSGVARTPLRLLIERHPVTRVTINNGGKPWDTFIVPARQAQPDLVIWKLPAFDGLARYLRAMPAVNDLLARYALADPKPGVKPPTAAEFAAMDLTSWWKWWEQLTDGDAFTLANKRGAALKVIVDLNKKLAEYAKLDVEPPAQPPTADELAGMNDPMWATWFDKVLWGASDDVWRKRNLGVRKIPDLDAAIASYAAADGGGTGPTATEVSAFPDDQWLEVWQRVIGVGYARRTELGQALKAGDLAKTLTTDRTTSWSDLLDHERKAMVHERERVVRTLVLPLLDTYDPTTQITDIVTVGKQTMPKRRAAAMALQNLDHYLIAPIENSHWITDPKKDPVERESHQAAALLRIALIARDKIVKPAGTDWVMRGWDRDVAWAWMPMIERTLKFLKTASALDPWLRADEQPASTWVPARTTALQNIYDGLWATMAANRGEFGFVSVQGDGTIENPGSIHEVGNDARLFGPGHAFTIDGITWEILAAPADFTYNPALIRSDGTVVLPPLLKVGDKEVPFDGSMVLLRLARDGEFFEVKNDDAGNEILRPLAFAVMMASTVEQLMELAEGMQTGTMFVIGLALDIAELFPVAGQAAAAGRVVLGVGSVLADPQFQELVKAFIEDPAGVLTSAWDKLKNSFTIEGIVENLLLNPGLEFLEDLASIGPSPRKTGSTTSGVGKILRRLASIARGIAGALGRVIGFAHDIRDDIQAFVLEHLVLARVLSFVAEHIYFISEIPELLADWESLPQKMVGLVATEFMDIVDSIGKIRLPEQLITMNDVVSVFLDIVGKRLGGKYAIGYKVIKALLEAVGKWGDVVDLITKGIVGVIGDPTKYLNVWMSFVNDWISPYIVKAQGFTRDVLNQIYKAIPWHTDELPAVKPLKIEHEGDKFLDAAPLMRSGASAPMPARVELSGGRPLAPGQRRQFEGQLGQDLSHVRVHTGGDAAHATTAVGARALTTGSHVLMAPDVALGTESGDRVMRHELVHVLQQTGPRAAGTGDTPETGEPGVGVNIDPAAERLAEEIAGKAGPTSIGARPVRGFQPNLFGMGQRFVDYLTHIERAKPEIDKIEKTGGGTGRKLIGKVVREDVHRVGAALTTWIEHFSAASMDPSAAPTFSPVVGSIHKWLKAQVPNITNAIEDLAIDASNTKKIRDDANETPEKVLAVETFQLKLVRFIVVATGCDIKITLNRKADGHLDPEKPLTSAVFEGMNLAVIPYEHEAGKELWDALMKSSFSGSPNDPNLRAVTRILLFALGFGDKPWASSGFELDSKFVKQITGEAKATAGIILPPAAQFWHGATPPADKTIPALWIGTHGAGTHHGMPDRQSHHTTQYLLVQYFEQKHSKRFPFPEMTADVAPTFKSRMNFDVDSKKVLKVDDIEVGTLDPTSSHRGSKMPALLVSAVMHRRGKLHVAPVAINDTDEDDSTSTQANSVHSWFRDALIAELGETNATAYWAAVDAVNLQDKPTATGLTNPAPDVAPLDWLVVHAPMLAKAFPAAMKKTYAQMTEIMEPPIGPALTALEKTWYEQLAVAQNKKITPGETHHVTDAMVLEVKLAAKANNETIMESQSHWA